MRKHFKNAIIILLTTVMVFGVTAASLPKGGNDAYAATGDQVHTIANPAGLTIDLFNYTVRDEQGAAVYNNYGTGGINADHALKFSNGTNTVTGFNKWTGSGAGIYTPTIVERNLKEGYPYLSSAVTDSPESLKYLFDDSNVYNNGDTNAPNKLSYMGCDELFTVDEAGYYVYESDKYSAVLNTDTKKFTVKEKANAQFYPFGDVSSSVHDYHFGVHMQADFSVPQNGVVLNPSGEYEQMIFSFVGDDDVWLYIDGILIGDVSGVHSAQDLDINFATGTVVVKNHENGNHKHETTIYKQVVAAYKEKYPEDSDEEITAKVMHDFRWDDTKVDGDGNPVTFAPGTYHTMNFFYLERGSGRSNLKIRYNFVSTYDFTAHKSLYRGNKDNEKPLSENQFHFKLTALGSEEYPDLDPVMPKVRPDNDVDWEPHYDAEPYKYLIAGNALDGNVNFGNANLTGDPDDPKTELGLYALKTFRYIYEELPPDGAVLNEDGSYTYKGNLVPKNPDGSYTFDGITYYLEKYYFEGTVSREGWINKTYYTDETFTHKSVGVYFADFSNFYDSIGRASISANKELQDLEGNKISLKANQFYFNLRQITDSATPYVQNGVGCASDGSVTFSPIVYSLKDLDGANQKVFTYEITEDVPKPADDDYDENARYSQDVYYAVVTVTDPGEGQSLTVTTEYYKGSVAAANKVDAAAVKFINKYDVTESTVKKVWNDNNNQNGNRPDSISVTFKANGQTVETYTLNADNNWTLTLSNLPKKAGGVEIEYTWVEESVPIGYVISSSVTVGTVTTITNTTETTEATVKKVWDDVDDQDGKRPETLTVKLSNGQSVILSEENGWEDTITGLPKYSNKTEIKYSWSEENVPAGYTLESNNTVGTITTITNKHTPEETEATVKKVWDDENNQDGKRPETLTVKLSNGTPVTLNEANGWTATVKNLPKYADGVEIKYSWSEENVPAGYTLESNNTVGTITTITNKHTPEETEATVKKVWDDENNQDGKRPETLTVKLSNGQSVTLSEANGWEDTITGLPKYSNGVEIEYTWAEGTLPTGYTLTNTSKDGTVTTLTNSYTPEKTEATVKKVWDDENNQDGKRPETLIVTLSNGQSVTLSEANGWEDTITGLPKYSNGVEIKYTWIEGNLPEGYSLTNTATSGTVTTLTNTYKPKTIDLTVKKVWDDANDQDGIRPDDLSVTLSNGTTVTLNDGNNWTATVEKLPMYNNGVEIKYTWTEESLPEGYKLENSATVGTVTTITNKHVPEKTEATVKKEWNDADNQDGIRPESLEVKLSNGAKITLNEENGWTATVTDLPKYADGVEIKYTWTEESLPEGYKLENSATVGTVTTITNKHVPEKTEATVKKVWDDANNQDGKRPETLIVTLSNGQSVTLSEANGWTATVTDLPKYADGVEIKYTWTEESLPEGYKLESSATVGTVTTITNKHVPEKTEATVKKEWNDDSDRDGIRPKALTVYLLADGSIIQTVSLSDENNWTATFDNLPKNSGGNPIEYKWQEEDLGDVYALTEKTEGTVTTLTNTHIPERTEVTVKKVWNDTNYSSLRPTTLVVELMRNNNGVLEHVNNDNGDPIKVTLTPNGWTASIGGLFKYEDGVEIKYTWQEAEVPEGYTLVSTETEGTITTITNKITTVDLVIVKKLPKFIVDGEQSYTFVFNVQIVDKNDETKVLREYHAGVIMTGTGSGQTELNGIPFDPAIHKLIVTEEYTAGYKQEGEIELTSNADGTVCTATVVNIPDTVIHTSGIINVYDDGEHQGTQGPSAEPQEAEPETVVTPIEEPGEN